MSPPTMLHPSVVWAQRKNCVFLTVCLDDCQNPEIKVENSTVYFKGAGGTDKKVHEANIELYDTINPADSMHVVRPRHIEFCLKKEKDATWPRLTKSTAKCPWIKVDFNKWKDEDSDDELGGGDQDFEEMMRQMGGLGGLPGREKPGLDDLDANASDSDDDDENLPDLE